MKHKCEIITYIVCMIVIAAIMIAPASRKEQTKYVAQMIIQPEVKRELKINKIPVRYTKEILIQEEVKLEIEVEQDEEKEKVYKAEPDEWNTEATYLAKMVWGEARGCNVEQKAAVIWCVLNRVDAGYGDIVSVITAPWQFSGFSYSNPVTDELYDLSFDVIGRWQAEKDGEENVGRVLPGDYLWFYGNGKENIFRNTYSGNYSIWDWSLESPYGE